MIAVERKLLAAAVDVAVESAKGSNRDEDKWTRVMGMEKEILLTGASGTMGYFRKVKVLDHRQSFDIAVMAERLKAALAIMDEGSVLISVEDVTLRLQQGKDIDISFETKPSSEVGAIQGFEKMTQVGNQVVNPDAQIRAVQHVAADHVGNTPLADVLMLMRGNSYLAGTIGAVRCDGGLVTVEQTVPIRVESLNVLSLMGPVLNTYADENRLLITDLEGWVTVSRWAGEYDNFAQQVVRIFASLRQAGSVRVNRKALLDVAASANTVLKSNSKEALYLTLECTKASMLVTANLGRYAYKRKLDADSSSGYKIHVHAGRLVAFLRHSEDEDVRIQVMDSNVVPNPRNAVHFTDSRLHEVMYLPPDKAIQEIPV